jgi:hypothetical protein
VCFPDVDFVVAGTVSVVVCFFSMKPSYSVIRVWRAAEFLQVLLLEPPQLLFRERAFVPAHLTFAYESKVGVGPTNADGLVLVQLGPHGLEGALFANVGNFFF